MVWGWPPRTPIQSFRSSMGIINTLGRRVLPRAEPRGAAMAAALDSRILRLVIRVEAIDRIYAVNSRGVRDEYLAAPAYLTPTPPATPGSPNLSLRGATASNAPRRSSERTGSGCWTQRRYLRNRGHIKGRRNVQLGRSTTPPTTFWHAPGDVSSCDRDLNSAAARRTLRVLGFGRSIAMFGLMQRQGWTCGPAPRIPGESKANHTNPS